MKKIFQFKVTQDNITEEVVIKKQEDGTEIKVLEKVNKPIEKTYFIGKPSLNVKQELGLYYESVVAECIKRGIFSVVQLRKRFIDDGGILAQVEKKRSEDLWASLWEKKAELAKLNEDPIKNADALKELDETILDILKNLQTIEEKSGVTNLYDHTAEKIASDRSTIWLMLFCSYRDLGNDKQEPVFFGNSYEEKLKKYEELENKEDSSSFELAQKLYLSAQLYYLGKAEKQEDFDNIFRMAEKDNLFTRK